MLPTYLLSLTFAWVCCPVADPERFDPDPDPTYHADTDPKLFS